MNSSIKRPPQSIDIFCKVIDNYGDIGVCWRLARDLKAESQASIRLWVDELHSFGKITPELDPCLKHQVIQGIHVHHWCSDNAFTGQPAEVVIEAFACDPPPACVQAMKGNTRLWLNLEYLSAEPWVESFHAQPSLQPNGLVKYFFFPGFTAKTGGLLREKNLLPERDKWQHNQPEQKNFLAPFFNATQLALWKQGAAIINLFCYPSAPVDELVQTLVKANQPVLLLVPEGVAPSLEAEAARLCACTAQISPLQVIRLPFIDQRDYDRLLWLGSLNFVRGEDSFIRAIWAARPFIWQIYEQQDHAHIIKLDAWLASSQTSMPVANVMRAWNNATGPGSFSTLFQDIFFNPGNYQQWAQEADKYCQNLSENKTLSLSILDIHYKISQKV
ncbi:elongation factor P maturation arginine rhamnosyltransferase EarP [Advenella sp. WQ 585]|uniref:Protein-arginine rhamnosyltransferase n=1 Tax=Advenella mandrilli TaxID=2800330 RepID=A0ABS1E870_9BURK|nr:elongation factor P maturation arginine rhamnosyltransferase EarP [Advenella mandrilli]MBK1779749.1 elongation factor P maturation arginine rhamnosyltransferase EarP [Advenella mandrilli]MDY0271111.1 elongation factor P maturation arginine rhamnosyltransferase EarP [Advenella sp.]